MGYYTKYEVIISDIEDDTQFIAISDYIKNNVGELAYNGIHMNSKKVISAEFESKWYTYEGDIIKLSKAFPNIIIFVKGVGEEFPDFWQARAKNGHFQRVNGIIKYPDFMPELDSV